jgi:spermidine synthase
MAAAEASVDSASLIIDGWFHERNEQWPGQAMSLQVKEVLLHKKTLFQDLLVFESTTWGKVLVLDGVIQLTEKDEMSYQEMMVHLPMFAHAEPKNVLIVGAGDGGVLREVCKHPGVEKIVQCEIDEGVVNASKQFFPSVAKCYDSDDRFTLNIADAVKYIEEVEEGSVDVIIVDSSDPVGPAEGLFSPAFYEKAHRALAPGGIMCCQGESLWIHADLINQMCDENAKPFASCEYASVQVPTYPCGQIGAFLCQKAKDGMLATCKKSRRDVNIQELRYYTAEMHEAAFALPKFLKDKIKMRP